MSTLYQLYAAALYLEEDDVHGDNTPPASPPPSPVQGEEKAESPVQELPEDKEEPLQQHHLSVEDQRNLIRFLRLLEVSKRDVARFTRRCRVVRDHYGDDSHEMLVTREQLGYAKRNYERILSQFDAFRSLH